MSPQNSVSNFELKFGYWWLLNRQKVGKVSLYIVLAISILYFFYEIISLSVLLVTMSKYNTTVHSTAVPQIQYNSFAKQFPLSEVVVENPTVVPAGEGAYDFVSRIGNPNERWGARRIDYRIESNEQVLQQGVVSLLPGEQKRILILGYKGTAPLSTARVVVTDVSWIFINPHSKPHEATFDISNVQYIPGENITNDLGQFVTRSYVTFDVQNTSPFALKNVTFNVLLMNGATIVGVNRVTVDELGTTKKHQASVSWFQEFIDIDRVIVEPFFDVFDENNFAPQEEKYKDLLKD